MKTLHIFIAGLAFISLVMLSSCDDSLGAEENVRITKETPFDTNYTSILENTSWLLDSYENDDREILKLSPSNLDEYYYFSIDFGENGLAWGRSGCNDYSCSFFADSIRLKIDSINSTYMDCTLTAEFASALSRSLFYAVNSDTLIITTANAFMEKMSFVKKP